MRHTRPILATTLLLACCTACGRAPNNDAPKPFNRYIASVLPLFAGTYHGNCKRGSEAPRKDAIAVSAAGLASNGILKHDLMREKGELSMMRILKAGKPELSAVMFQGKTPEWTFMLSSHARAASAPDESVSLGEGDNPVVCKDLEPASGLAGRALYPAVAAHFGAASGPMICEGNKMGKREKTEVRIGPRGVTVGAFAVAFDRELKHEQLVADELADTLSYTVNYNDGGEFSMAIDGAGALVSASFLDSSTLWVCKRQ